jgi:hypothetical protein
MFHSLYEQVLEKQFSTGFSKIPVCKARDFMKNEAYFFVSRNDERNPATAGQMDVFQQPAKKGWA